MNQPTVEIKPQISVLVLDIGFEQIALMRNRIQNLVTSVCSMTKGKEWKGVVWENPGIGVDLHKSKDGHIWRITFWISENGHPFIKEVVFVFQNEVLFKFVAETKHTEVFIPPETTGIVYDNRQGFLDAVRSVSLTLDGSLKPFKEAAERRGIC